MLKMLMKHPSSRLRTGRRNDDYRRNMSRRILLLACALALFSPGLISCGGGNSSSSTGVRVAVQVVVGCGSGVGRRQCHPRAGSGCGHYFAITNLHRDHIGWHRNDFLVRGWRRERQRCGGHDHQHR